MTAHFASRSSSNPFSTISMTLAGTHCHHSGYLLDHIQYIRGYCW